LASTKILRRPVDPSSSRSIAGKGRPLGPPGKKNAMQYMLLIYENEAQLKARTGLQRRLRSHVGRRLDPT